MFWLLYEHFYHCCSLQIMPDQFCFCRLLLWSSISVLTTYVLAGVNLCPPTDVASLRLLAEYKSWICKVGDRKEADGALRDITVVFGLLFSLFAPYVSSSNLHRIPFLYCFFFSSAAISIGLSGTFQGLGVAPITNCTNFHFYSYCKSSAYLNDFFGAESSDQQEMVSTYGGHFLSRHGPWRGGCLG